MGCGASNEPEAKADDQPKKPAKLVSGLSPEHADLVKESWERMNKDPAGMSRNFFTALEEHDASKKVKEHSKGQGCQFWDVMGEMVEIGLDTDKEKYKPFKEKLKGLGKKHVDYDIEEFYYGQYYRALVKVLEVSSEEEQAWRALYMWGSKIAVEAHRKEAKKRKQKKEEAEANERLKLQMLSNDSDLPTDAQRVMVQHQVKSLESFKKFDEIYFKNLFTHEESLKVCFPTKLDGGEPDTSKCTVRDSVLKSVALMDDLEKLMEYNEPIGMVHHKNNVPEKHYYAAWLAYMEMIPKIFKDLYPELQLAWKSSFNLFTTCMIPDEENNDAPIEGMPPDGAPAAAEGAPAAETAEATPEARKSEGGGVETIEAA